MITQSETSLFGSERRSCASRVVLEPLQTVSFECTLFQFRGHVFEAWNDLNSGESKHLAFREQRITVFQSPVESNQDWPLICYPTVWWKLSKDCKMSFLYLEWRWRLGKKTKTKKNKQCAFGGWGSFHSKGIDNWFLQIWSTLKVSVGDDMSRIPQECVSYGLTAQFMSVPIHEWAPPQGHGHNGRGTQAWPVQKHNL